MNIEEYYGKYDSRIIVRELFGSDFLTENYHLTDLDYIEV
jgi:hypothetical protein